MFKCYVLENNKLNWLNFCTIYLIKTDKEQVELIITNKILYLITKIKNIKLKIIKYKDYIHNTHTYYMKFHFFLQLNMIDIFK